MNKPTFGQRFGLEELPAIQLSSLSYDTKVDLYNTYYMFLYEPFRETKRDIYGHPYLHYFIWMDFLKHPIDSLPDTHTQFIMEIKNFILKSDWYKVYNFFEYVISLLSKTGDFDFDKEGFVMRINKVMIKENTAFRVVEGEFIAVTNDTEIEEIKKLKQTSVDLGLNGVAEHLSASLKLISMKPNPDLRNSIKESISMVGAIARLIEPENDLGKSLHRLEKKNLISPSLSAKFKSFYNYTSSKEGIRHELMDEPNLTLAESRYFLVACSAFANYLIDQASSNGLLNKLGDDLDQR